MTFFLDSKDIIDSVQDWIGTLAVFIVYAIVTFLSSKKKKKNERIKPSHSSSEEEIFSRLLKKEKKEHKNREDFKKSIPPVFLSEFFPEEKDHHDKKIMQPSRGKLMVNAIKDKKSLLLYKEIFDLPLSLRPYDKL